MKYFMWYVVILAALFGCNGDSIDSYSIDSYSVGDELADDDSDDGGLDPSFITSSRGAMN